jgi:DNA segregation ATPase FtsK/SpoIIIE-like protein
MNEFEYRKQFEAEFPPLIDDVYQAHGILAEKLYAQPTPFLTGCTSYIQRKMQCGYNHAAAIMALMEEKGGITATDSKGARQLKPLSR